MLSHKVLTTLLEPTIFWDSILCVVFDRLCCPTLVTNCNSMAANLNFQKACHQKLWIQENCFQTTVFVPVLSLFFIKNWRLHTLLQETPHQTFPSTYSTSKKSLVSVEPNLLQAHCEMMTIWPTKDFHAEIVSNKSWHRSGRYIHCPWYNFLFFKDRLKLNCIHQRGEKSGAPVVVVECWKKNLQNVFAEHRVNPELPFSNLY